MARKNKYSIKDLRADFPTDASCVEFLFDVLHSRRCSCGGTYAPLFRSKNTKLEGRKQFQCSKCRFQIAPTSGTIFHKSSTPLTLWFHALFVFSNAKSGVSAKEMERQLGVTYKTAYRILKQIRASIAPTNGLLKGVVEVDGGYIGGVARVNRRMENKIPIMVAVQRNGEIRAEVMEDMSGEAHRYFINKYVDKGSILVTDSAKHYVNSAKNYDRVAINHSKAYADGEIHINKVETFFSHLKRSIGGTYKAISQKNAQSYLDAFVFQYNMRHSDRSRFDALIASLSQPLV